jgi:hypothetical protein
MGREFAGLNSFASGWGWGGLLLIALGVWALGSSTVGPLAVVLPTTRTPRSEPSRPRFPERVDRVLVTFSAKSVTASAV